MAGRPLGKLRKVECLREAAGQLAAEIEAVMPSTYMDLRPEHGEIGGAWRDAWAAALQAESALFGLVAALEDKIAKKGPVAHNNTFFGKKVEPDPRPC